MVSVSQPGLVVGLVVCVGLSLFWTADLLLPELALMQAAWGNNCPLQLRTNSLWVWETQGLSYLDSQESGLPARSRWLLSP